MHDIYKYTRDELARILVEKKQLPTFCAGQIFDWIYKKRVEDFDKMTDISKDARAFLKDTFYFSAISLAKKQVSSDGTEKFLFRLKDGARVESVVIPREDRFTLCVSTQAGCKFGCEFCASGTGGFERNLSVSEIIQQYVRVSDIVSPRAITNVVFMGIGEPLDNFEATVAALRILLDHKGIGLGKRRICVSTCGLIPQIERLSQLSLGVKLSLSLHTADDAGRTKIMPVNKRYPLPKVMRALKKFSLKARHPITFEYAMISGFNTRPADAKMLARLLRGIKYKLNLMSLNKACSTFEPPSEREIDIFIQELKRQNIFFTLRRSRGDDIAAACGQLRAGALRK